MTRSRLAPLWLLTLLACAPPADHAPAAVADAAARQDEAMARCVRTDARGSCTLFGVSLIELIANPTRYDGKPVQTSGYVVLGSHDGAVFVSEGDARNAVAENSVVLPLLDTALLRQFRKRSHYGVVMGTFRRDQRGTDGVRAGAIERP